MQRGEIVVEGRAAEVAGRLDEIEATYMAGTIDESCGPLGESGGQN